MIFTVITLQNMDKPRLGFSGLCKRSKDHWLSRCMAKAWRAWAWSPGRNTRPPIFHQKFTLDSLKIRLSHGDNSFFNHHHTQLSCKMSFFYTLQGCASIYQRPLITLPMEWKDSWRFHGFCFEIYWCFSKCCHVCRFLWNDFSWYLMHLSTNDHSSSTSTSHGWSSFYQSTWPSYGHQIGICPISFFLTNPMFLEAQRQKKSAWPVPMVPCRTN